MPQRTKKTREYYADYSPKNLLDVIMQQQNILNSPSGRICQLEADILRSQNEITVLSEKLEAQKFALAGAYDAKRRLSL